MRLLNTKTFEVLEFSDEKLPSYAILSHRWEKEEVTFRDVKDGKGRQLRGWSKLEGLCERARTDGWEYAWMDSCCIEKTSSAELSEAINSMFRWYQNSRVCYVYMSDVRLKLRDRDATDESFCKSLWFTRGWTLQELLGPTSIEFYDQDWQELGTKMSLSQQISQVSGISREHLWDFGSASVAQKMSWVSKRVTTRVEDEAYSLLGLFDVNMPPLYGEGRHAFLRLQQEIMNRYDDETLFAWNMVDQSGGGSSSRLAGGLLAESAACFRNTSQVFQSAYIDRTEAPKMTNQGLSINLLLVPASGVPSNEKHFIAPLNCRDMVLDAQGNLLRSRRLALKVERFSPSTYGRTRGVEGSDMSTAQLKTGTARTVYFPQKRADRSNRKRDEYKDRIFVVNMASLQGNGFVLQGITPAFQWPEVARLPTSLQSLPFLLDFPQSAEPLDSVDENNGRYIRLESHHLDSAVPSNDVEMLHPDRSTAPQHFMFEDRRRMPHGTITFQKEGFPPVVLLYHVIWKIVLIDLTILYAHETASKVYEMSASHFKYALHTRPPDRISLKLADGYYISAAVKIKGHDQTHEPVVVVDMAIDNFEKWPSPDKDFWKERDEKRLRTHVENLAGKLEATLTEMDTAQ